MQYTYIKQVNVDPSDRFNKKKKYKITLLKEHMQGPKVYFLVLRNKKHLRDSTNLGYFLYNNN